MLVKFIAVDNKKLIDDNYAYIDDIYKAIRTGGLIKNLNIDPDAAAFGVGAVREVDDDGNAFVLEFNSADGEKSNIWSVYFTYGTYNDSKQLEISIYSDTYVPKVDEGYLEKLKIRIKKSIKKSISKDWERIIWLVDKDSECLSICLYPQIYKVENLMREVINEVMTKQYGISWWDSYVPANIKKKHSDRLKEYKSKVPSFNDVDERLMSIDIDDLGALVQHTSTVTLCVQPIGQIVYGFLFDRFSNMIYLCLIPTGIIVCVVGMSAMGFFRKLEKEQQEVSA